MGKNLWLAGFIIVGVMLGAGILLLVTRPPRGEAVELLPPPTEAPIMVYVSGKVVSVGLYTLPPGSRVNDAIQAAGGFSEEAGTNALNLAELLVDGEQVDVPGIAPTPAVESTTRSITLGSNPVNINSATMQQLDSLPGIGPKTAQDIIDYRDLNGPFVRIEGILEVPGIGQVTFEKIKNLISVGTSP